MYCKKGIFFVWQNSKKLIFNFFSWFFSRVLFWFCQKRGTQQLTGYQNPPDFVNKTKKPIITNFDYSLFDLKHSPWSYKFTLWSPGWSRSKSWQLQGGLFDEKIFILVIWIWIWGTFMVGIRESKTLGFGWDWHGSKGFWGQGHERTCFRACLLKGWGVRDLDVHRWTGRSDQDWFGMIGLTLKPWVVEDSFQVDSVTGWDG